MVLVTQLSEKGLEVGLFASDGVIDVAQLAKHEVPSEQYLRVLDALVKDWGLITGWYTRVDADSFTSIRGLVTIINTLAPLHEIPVYVFSDMVREATRAELPMVPRYASEPNIGKRKR